MEYFEDLAELIESEEELKYEDIYQAVSESTPETLGEILENYMEELLNAIPDAEQELYMLVENIKTGMLFLCEDLEDDSIKSEFAEELQKFRNWYIDPEKALVDGNKTSVIDAVATARANKITGEESEFDFTGALDYELKDFSFSLGSFKQIDILGEDQESDQDLEANKLN